MTAFHKPILCAILAGLFTTGCFAADPPAAKPPAIDTNTPDGVNNFFQDWGVGLALVRNSKRAVADASIVGGTVRVSQSASYEGTLLVARHFYPFRPSGRKKCGLMEQDNTWYRDCLGAMVGVGLGSSSANSQLINFVGVGVTMGGGVGDNSARAWHLGLGIGRKFNVKTLGDGFVENGPPPAGETQVRFHNKDITAPFAYFTAHW